LRRRLERLENRGSRRGRAASFPSPRTRASGRPHGFPRFYRRAVGNSSCSPRPGCGVGLLLSQRLASG
jgi:hypothetical protein